MIINFLSLEKQYGKQQTSYVLLPSNEDNKTKKIIKMNGLPDGIELKRPSSYGVGDCRRILDVPSKNLTFESKLYRNMFTNT